MGDLVWLDHVCEMRREEKVFLHKPPAELFHLKFPVSYPTSHPRPRRRPRLLFDVPSPSLPCRRPRRRYLACHHALAHAARPRWPTRPLRRPRTLAAHLKFCSFIDHLLRIASSPLDPETTYFISYLLAAVGAGDEATAVSVRWLHRHKR
jgi:hypothetical protein